MATGVPITVPTGALVGFSDGRIETVAPGTVAVPTDATGPAGFTPIAAEVIQTADVAANDPVTIQLDGIPLIPASLIITSLDLLTLMDSGDGSLAGDIGTGTNAVDLMTGAGQCSFNAPAAGPIVADYQQFGTALGTLFTLTTSGGVPLGMGTITLSNGTVLQGTTTAFGLGVTQYETVEFVVDPAPSAPGLSLSDDNLDAETLAIIADQIRECSELIQHELTMSGTGMPWLRRGAVLEITELHDEAGGEFVVPAFLISARTHTQDNGRSAGVQRKITGLAWSHPGIMLPPGASVDASGDAATFTRLGFWQPNTAYDALDAVQPGPGIAGLQFVAVRLFDDGTTWSLPAISGATTPFASVVAGLIRPIDLEGTTVIDGALNGWYGCHRLITLTGTVVGETMEVRDAGGVVHYVTYYPDVNVWTDTPEPPGM
jgi:hypothetical protein